jgi:6-methylsalicylate decarboxylase
MTRVRVDVHQHFWSEPFVGALAARDALPCGRREGGGFVVRAGGEVPYMVDLGRERVEERAALLDRDGVDRALVALSSTLGVEALPRAQSLPLIDAYLDGAFALGERFGVWGPVALDGAGPGDVDALLARGCTGVSVPAGALDGAAAALTLGPVFARLAQTGAPLFVHPGPGLGSPAAEAPAGQAAWWSALTTYVRQMQAAWLTFVAFVRPAHPRLCIVFAMLAGTAPLLSERLAARGGPTIDLADPLAYYETSSFGDATVRLVAQVTGDRQLLYGSDRPVVEPRPGAYARALAEQGGRLPGGDGGLRG